MTILIAREEHVRANFGQHPEHGEDQAMVDAILDDKIARDRRRNEDDQRIYRQRTIGKDEREIEAGAELLRLIDTVLEKVTDFAVDDKDQESSMVYILATGSLIYAAATIRDRGLLPSQILQKGNPKGQDHTNIVTQETLTNLIAHLDLFLHHILYPDLRSQPRAIEELRELEKKIVGLQAHITILERRRALWEIMHPIPQVPLADHLRSDTPTMPQN